MKGRLTFNQYQNPLFSLFRPLLPPSPLACPSLLMNCPVAVRVGNVPIAGHLTASNYIVTHYYSEILFLYALKMCMAFCRIILVAILKW